MTNYECSFASTALAVVIATILGLSAPAGAQERAEAGMLTCDVSAGIGMIITSRKDVTCLFIPSPNLPGSQEVYIGSILKFGLDLGATGGGQMIWAVYAPTTRRFGALAGSYVGATAEATIVAGLGANVLVGGSDRTITLQPLSVQGQVGLNLAVGVAELQLRLVQ